MQIVIKSGVKAKCNNCLKVSVCSFKEEYYELERKVFDIFNEGASDLFSYYVDCDEFIGHADFD